MFINKILLPLVYGYTINRKNNVKITEQEAEVKLTLNGALATELLNGGQIIEKRFNGWDWSILVKFAKPSNDGFTHGQYETMENINSDEFHLMVSRKGGNKAVLKAWLKDCVEVKVSKDMAFKLGNIK